jgi:hypothetical protein
MGNLEKVLEILSVVAITEAVSVNDISVLTGLSKQQIYNAVNVAKNEHIIEKLGNVMNRRYRYVGHREPGDDFNHEGLNRNQEGIILPAVKRALSTTSVNTAVHIGWKSENGTAFCLCGQNQVVNKLTKTEEDTSSEWYEVGSGYTEITCKRCIQAWNSNRVRPGDSMSSQEYVIERVRREHIVKPKYGCEQSYLSQPVPLDSKMLDEPHISRRKKVVIRFEENADTTAKTNTTEPAKKLKTGDLLNIQLKVAKLERAPAGQKVESYKCQFCCFNGHRPCPKASLNRGETRYLCYEVGPEYYFIEVIQPQ